MAKRRYYLTKREVNDIHAYMDERDDPARNVRLRAVLMYGTGSPVEEILEQVGCSRSSLLSWCRAYRFRGLSGLEDQRRGGNNARLTDGQIADLTRRLQIYSPRSIFGQKASTSDGQQWMVEDLFKAIKLWYGVVYQSRSSYYKILEMCAADKEQAETTSP